MPTYTIADLVERWQISSRTLLRKLKSGELPGFKLGHQWRITAATVTAVETNTIQIRKEQTHDRTNFQG